MLEIINKKSLYEKDPIDAIITNKTIIPGIKGIKIDLNNTYDKMKKLGFFNETLLVYQEVLPKKSYLNKFDKIIISGNINKNNLALVFNINSSIMYNKINTILKKSNNIGNYYLENGTILNKPNLLNEIKENILVNNLHNIKKYQKYIDYCLVYNINTKLECLNNQKYTLLSKININNFHLTYLKNNIKKGDILTLTFNDKNINNLPLILNYINNNNYQTVSIDNLLDE